MNKMLIRVSVGPFVKSIAEHLPAIPTLASLRRRSHMSSLTDCDIYGSVPSPGQATRPPSPSLSLGIQLRRFPPP